MTTESKLQKFLEVSKITETMKQAVRQMCEAMKANFEKRGDDIGEGAMDAFAELYDFLWAKMEGQLVTFYQGLLTDEDLDELIAIHSLPLFQRMRDLVPEITNRVVAFFDENQEEINQEAERIYSNAMNKIEDDLETKENTESFLN